MTVALHLADCRDVLADLPDASVDAIVTDPPYELGFMGRGWDRTGIANDVALWAECLRVLKPGGHLAAFGDTRTYHRMTCAIEDAGFEIRDGLQWLYGSGFPKGQDVGKAIDATLLHGGANSRRIKATNASRPGEARTRTSTMNNGIMGENRGEKATRDQPATPDGGRWQGWGTALKPAHEPIVLARKPLSGTVAATVLEHGTGALNVAACRVAHASAEDLAESEGKNRHGDFGSGPRTNEVYGRDEKDRPQYSGAAGRWPANVLLSHGDCDDECEPGCPVAELDAQSGISSSRGAAPRASAAPGHGWGMTATGAEYDDSGGASRFFPTFRYQAKAPTRERPKIDGKGWPTVKPLDLMRWLVRLVTPPGGLVLDPFAGTGTTLQAAELEGFRALGAEADRFAYELACQRLGLPVQEVAS